jgi:hypothetical protein
MRNGSRLGPAVAGARRRSPRCETKSVRQLRSKRERRIAARLGTVILAPQDSNVKMPRRGHGKGLASASCASRRLSSGSRTLNSAQALRQEFEAYLEDLRDSQKEELRKRFIKKMSDIVKHC